VWNFSKQNQKPNKVVTKHTFAYSQNMKISTTSKKNKLHNKKNTHTHTYIEII